MPKSRTCNICYQIIKISGNERHSTCTNVHPKLTSTYTPLPSVSPSLNTGPCFMHVCVSIAEHSIVLVHLNYIFLLGMSSRPATLGTLSPCLDDSWLSQPPVLSKPWHAIWWYCVSTKRQVLKESKQAKDSAWLRASIRKMLISLLLLSVSNDAVMLLTQITQHLLSYVVLQLHPCSSS